MYKEIDNKPGESLPIHCAENLKQIFPEMKLRGLVPNLYIHVSASDLYSPTIGLPILMYVLCLRTDRSLDYINRSQIHEHRKW